eukprot:1147314-Pelagomonas_calceolata.AAC.6
MTRLCPSLGAVQQGQGRSHVHSQCRVCAFVRRCAQSTLCWKGVHLIAANGSKQDLYNWNITLLP